MGQPFWDGSGGLLDAAWSFVWLGGNLLPGLSTVDCPLKRSVEKKKTKGADGTTITDQGDELAPVKIRTEVYTPDQWSRWQTIFPEIWVRRAGGERQPLEIVHPLPNALGISAIYVEGLHVSHPESQVMIIEIAGFDWSPAIRQLAASAKQVQAAPKRATTPVMNGFSGSATGVQTRSAGGGLGSAAGNAIAPPGGRLGAAAGEAAQPAPPSISGWTSAFLQRITGG